jgi:magnesium transporter
MTSIATDILSGMMDAFASIISNNVNSVMKLLTALTIVVSMPTIVSSFFGMNVSIPYGDHPLAYLGILGLTIVLTVGTILTFAKRDWF